MRRAPMLSLLLWSTVGCGTEHNLVDAGAPGTDLPPTGAAVAFGDADCGTTPMPQTLSFHNTGTAELSWTATIQGGGFAITAGAQGAAQPGETASITIAPDAVPATATVGQPIAATLFIATNASSQAIVVPLSLTAHGGSLHVVTPTIGFGQVQLTASVDQPLDIENAGDRPIQIALAAPGNGDFTASWTGAPDPASVDPAGTLAGAAAHFRPTDAITETDAIAIEATGPLCAGDAPSIAISGEGTAAQVSITPGTIQFGTTACGATAAAKPVTIQNDYGFPIHYTATITSGPYAITAGQSTGTVPANGTATILVKANAVPKAASSLTAGALAGAMTVTTDAPASSPATLTMAQGASGAVLAVTPAPGQTIAFGDVAYGTPAVKPYSVKNTGNAAATVTATATGSGFSAAAPGGGTVPANGVDTAANVTETVAQRGSLTGTLTVATTTPLCQASAPGAINLTANGRAAVSSIGAAPAMTALCGNPTPPSVNVSVQNTGDEPLVIGSGSATGGFAVVTTLPLTIQPGASANIAVRPPAAAVGVDAAGTVKTGVLSLATNEIGNPTRTVALSSTVTGAALTVSPAPGQTIAFGNVDAGTPSSQAYSVKNTGNLGATIAVATAGAGFSATTPGGGAIPANGVAQGATVTETVAQHGSVTGTLTVSSTTAQCTTPPGAVNLSAFGRTPNAVIGAVPSMSAACGAGTPGTVDVSIQNSGDGPLTINASASGGFVITSGLPMTIAAGGSGSITVRPPTAVVGTDLGGSTKTGTLTITTNELGTSTHQLGLSSTVIGANVSLTDQFGNAITSAAFDANQACPAEQTIFVKNSGNTTAHVAITTANFQLFRWGFFSPSSDVGPASSVSHTLDVFTVNNACTGSEQIQYAVSGTICTATPLNLQATFNISGQSGCFCS